MVSKAGSEPVLIRNLAVDGFGIDQMATKAEREIGEWPADLVIVAFIDHDLTRPSRSFMFELPRPTFRPSGWLGQGVLEAVPPESIEAFYGRHRRAVHGFHYGLWSLSLVLDQRRYYARELYVDYYGEVFALSIRRMIAASEAAGVPLALVRLPQAFAFRGREALVDRFTAERVRLDPDGRVLAPDLEPCMREVIDASGDRFESVMRGSHPDPDGHAALATCLWRELVGPRVDSNQR